MTLARYFVTRHGDEWLVTLDGRPVARHESRVEATEDAIAMADHMGSMSHDADVMVEPATDEPPELVWTYGQDRVSGADYHGDGRPSHVRRVQRAGGL